jgi:hypothetical protein
MTDAPMWTTYVQVGAWAAATLTAGVGVVRFGQDNRKARDQRKDEQEQRRQDDLKDREQREVELEQRRQANEAADRELEWRRGVAAQSLLEKMEEDELAADAMLMLDWDGREFSDGEKTWPLDKAQTIEALRVRGRPFTDAEVYVRDAFDHLFWYFERIQHQIEIDLISVEHVRFPIAYLIAVMNEDRTAFRDFLEAYGYRGSLWLLDEFEKRGLPDVARHYEVISSDIAAS